MERFKNLLACSTCFHHIAKMHPQAARLWLTLCHYSEEYGHTHFWFPPCTEKTEEALRQLELNAVIVSTDRTHGVIVKLLTNSDTCFCPLHHD